jgi:hypothetical protein
MDSKIKHVTRLINNKIQQALRKLMESRIIRRVKFLKDKKNVFKSMKILVVIVVLVIISAIAYNNNKTIFGEGLRAKATYNIGMTKGPVVDQYNYFNNYDEADASTDLLIIGVVTKIYPAEVGYIPCDVKVDNVIKGDCKKGDIIQIQQNIIMSKYYKIGKKYVFFLGDSRKSTVPYLALNPEQGGIPITNGRVEQYDNQQLIKADVSEKKLIAELKTKILKLKANNKK